MDPIRFHALFHGAEALEISIYLESREFISNDGFGVLHRLSVASRRVLLVHRETPIERGYAVQPLVLLPPHFQSQEYALCGVCAHEKSNALA